MKNQMRIMDLLMEGVLGILVFGIFTSLILTHSQIGYYDTILFQGIFFLTLFSVFGICRYLHFRFSLALPSFYFMGFFLSVIALIACGIAFFYFSLDILLIILTVFSTLFGLICFLFSSKNDEKVFFYQSLLPIVSVFTLNGIFVSSLLWVWFFSFLSRFFFPSLFLFAAGLSFYFYRNLFLLRREFDSVKRLFFVKILPFLVGFLLLCFLIFQSISQYLLLFCLGASVLMVVLMFQLLLKTPSKSQKFWLCFNVSELFFAYFSHFQIYFVFPLYNFYLQKQFIFYPLSLLLFVMVDFLAKWVIQWRKVNFISPSIPRTLFLTGYLLLYFSSKIMNPLWAFFIGGILILIGGNLAKISFFNHYRELLNDQFSFFELVIQGFSVLLLLVGTEGLDLFLNFKLSTISNQFELFFTTLIVIASGYLILALVLGGLVPLSVEKKGGENLE